jgi:hypothetical protein
MSYHFSCKILTVLQIKYSVFKIHFKEYQFFFFYLSFCLSSGSTSALNAYCAYISSYHQSYVAWNSCSLFKFILFFHTKRNRFLSILKDQLVSVFKYIIIVYSENTTKHIRKLCGQYSEFNAILNTNILYSAGSRREFEKSVCTMTSYGPADDRRVWSNAGMVTGQGNTYSGATFCTTNQKSAALTLNTCLHEKRLSN